jgi:hypothetical protein
MHQGALNVPVSRGPGLPKHEEAKTYEHEGLQAAVPPRLFNLDTAAAYLSMSPWTIRDLEAKGILPRVRVPLPQGGELRKLLFDKADLDRLIGA